MGHPFESPLVTSQDYWRLVTLMFRLMLRYYPYLTIICPKCLCMENKKPYDHLLFLLTIYGSSDRTKHSLNYQVLQSSDKILYNLQTFSMDCITYIYIPAPFHRFVEMVIWYLQINMTRCTVHVFYATEEDFYESKLFLSPLSKTISSYTICQKRFATKLKLALYTLKIMFAFANLLSLAEVFIFQTTFLHLGTRKQKYYFYSTIGKY
jgi:hypothetical protein